MEPDQITVYHKSITKWYYKTSKPAEMIKET